MPALNFKKQFAPKVEDGTKRQTIRAKRKDGRNPRPGQTLYLYTGMRTKSCRKLRVAVCAHVGECIMDAHLGIYVDGNWLDYDQEEDFAIADGFTSWPEMKEFFHKEHGLPFSGLVIKW